MEDNVSVSEDNEAKVELDITRQLGFQNNQELQETIKVEVIFIWTVQTGFLFVLHFIIYIYYIGFNKKFWTVCLL